MIKHEIKIEYSNSEALRNIIEFAYFIEGDRGRILGKENFLRIEDSDEVSQTIFKGLNGVTTKITNEDVIDGTMRFMIDETNNEIRLYPISIYCIKEENKYIFY